MEVRQPLELMNSIYFSRPMDALWHLEPSEEFLPILIDSFPLENDYKLNIGPVSFILSSHFKVIQFQSIMFFHNKNCEFKEETIIKGAYFFPSSLSKRLKIIMITRSSYAFVALKTNK